MNRQVMELEGILAFMDQFTAKDRDNELACVNFLKDFGVVASNGHLICRGKRGIAPFETDTSVCTLAKDYLKTAVPTPYRKQYNFKELFHSYERIVARFSTKSCDEICKWLGAFSLKKGDFVSLHFFIRNGYDECLEMTLFRNAEKNRVLSSYIPKWTAPEYQLNNLRLESGEMEPDIIHVSAQYLKKMLKGMKEATLCIARGASKNDDPALFIGNDFCEFLLMPVAV